MTGGRGLGLAFALLLVNGLGVFWVQRSQPYLHGEDGYYYALQADWWARTGQVRIPDPSPIHRIAGQLQRWGMSTEDSLRAWESLTIFVFAVGLLFAAAPRLRLAALIWGLVSASPIFMSLHFPKQFSALALVPWWFVAHRLTGRWRSTSIVLLPCLSLTLHPSCLPFVLSYWAWSAAKFQQAIPRRFAWAAMAAAGAVLVGGLCLRGSLVVEWLQGWQQWRPAGWLLCGQGSEPLAWKLEYCLGLAAVVVLAKQAWQREGWAIGLAWALFAVIALFPSVPGDSPDAGQRFALAFPVVAGALVLFGGDAQAAGPEVLGRPWVWVVLVALAFAAPWRLAFGAPVSLDPDNQRYEQVVQAMQDKPVDMLIAHHGLSFYYKFRTKREAFAYEPEPFWDKTRVWRLAFKISPQELAFYLPAKAGPSSGLWQALPVPDYVLVREDCWDAFRQAVTWDQDSDLYGRIHDSWRNPSQRRPAFLYAKHAADPADPFPAIAPAGN